jgi:hypothetical protein
VPETIVVAFITTVGLIAIAVIGIIPQIRKNTKAHDRGYDQLLQISQTIGHVDGKLDTHIDVLAEHIETHKTLIPDLIAYGDANWRTVGNLLPTPPTPPTPPTRV